MNTGKLLILGASIYQVPLIRAARRMGLYTIVSTIPGRYPGLALADRACYVDTTDAEGILKIAREERISGICTGGTDVAVRTIGRVCEELSLPGLSAAAAAMVTDKYLMKERLVRSGVRTAPFIRVGSAEEAARAYEQLGPRIMLKIVDSSGSRGVRQALSMDEARTLFSELITLTRRPYILAEQYISGREIGVDLVVTGGQIHMLTPHGKLVCMNGGTGVPAGHYLPFEAPREVKERIGREAEAAVRALELDECAVNMDVFLDEDGRPWIIEVGGRSGATGIPEIMSLYYDTDYYGIIIRLALGERAKLPDRSRDICCASRLIFSERDGVLREIRLPQEDWCSASVEARPGEKVLRFTNGTRRLGQMLITAPDPQTLQERLKTAEQQTRIILEGEEDGR